MSGDIIPFGKYKGKPVEALAQDRQYVDWLTAQPWFRERFRNIYTLIVNNFQEPASTPAHNRLQVMFLAEDFRRKVFAHIYGKVFGPVECEFESGGFDVKIASYEPEPNDITTPMGGCRYNIEIKPSVGDDFPAILRNIKSIERMRENLLGRSVLFLEEYVGEGATVEQFIAVFESAQIKVVFLEEVIDKA